MPEVPTFIEDLLCAACAPIERDDAQVAVELYEFSRRAYAGAWEAGLNRRESWDNHAAHEAVVWRNTARILWTSSRDRAASGGCELSELRVACLTSFFHDIRPLVRVTEEEIAAAERRGDLQEAKRLADSKALVRTNHMKGSAEDTRRWLEQHPELASVAERERCVGYISLHDLCKVGWPYPLTSDWLAVGCFEGDVLWPLDPEFGPLADLQRKGVMNPGRRELEEQAKSNFATQLLAYRSSSFGGISEGFRGGTIIRTAEGGRILSEMLQFWGIEAPAGLTGVSFGDKADLPAPATGRSA